jgi:hypothetical protein
VNGPSRLALGSPSVQVDPGDGLVDRVTRAGLVARAVVYLMVGYLAGRVSGAIGSWARAFALVLVG